MTTTYAVKNRRVGSHLRLTLQAFLVGKQSWLLTTNFNPNAPEYESVEAMHAYIKSKNERDT